MYIDLTYGLNIDVVFKRFENRVKMDEVKYITTSLKIELRLYFNIPFDVAK